MNNTHHQILFILSSFILMRFFSGKIVTNNDLTIHRIHSFWLKCHCHWHQLKYSKCKQSNRLHQQRRRRIFAIRSFPPSSCIYAFRYIFFSLSLSLLFSLSMKILFIIRELYRRIIHPSNVQPTMTTIDHKGIQKLNRILSIHFKWFRVHLSFQEHQTTIH